MKYIYEGHMGGLYCTDYEVEDTYCEQCGDSDWLIGTASTLEGAWDLLKFLTDTFDDSKCKNCLHNGDYDYCDEECDEAMNSGGYNLPYVMQFLTENFKCKEMHSIYLISKHVHGNNYILVDCDIKGFKFGGSAEIDVISRPPIGALGVKLDILAIFTAFALLSKESV